MRSPATPYASQHELISDQLAAVRARVRTAAEHLTARSEHDRAVTPWSADLLAAERRIEARLIETSAELAFPRIRGRFGLSSTEERVLWVLAAHELCPIVRHLIRGLGTEDSADPTMDVLRRVAYGHVYARDVWRELGPDGVLRRYSFIERTDGCPDAPEHRQTWKVSRRVLALLHDDLQVDTELSEIARPVSLTLRPEELALNNGVLARVEAAFDRKDLVIAHGRVGTGRRTVLSSVAARRGLSVLEVEARALAADRCAATRQIRMVSRECLLLDLVPLIRDLDSLRASSEHEDRLAVIEAELDGLVLATSNAPIARRWRRKPVSVALGPLSSAQRMTVWRRALPEAGAGDLEILATTYPLAPAMIEATGRLARASCGPMQQMQPAHIQAAVREVVEDRFGGLAHRVAITQKWEDLVLPDDQSTALHELIARVRERERVYDAWGFGDKVGRGQGVAALFSGPPGTGKTMAAGLVAGAMEVDLYQVDLSRVVSKWLGETEKNLATVFDAADAGHAVLLFDEADSLFGKRTEVRSSNDRYANQEVNFLLQRIESFAGICILTTNHDSAIDEAFRRRLAMHVRFPTPLAEERLQIWKSMLPATAPLDADLQLEGLASKYAMSGGYIRNAVVRAAFIAATEGGTIDRARLGRAAQLEYESLGKLVASRP